MGLHYVCTVKFTDETTVEVKGENAIDDTFDNIVCCKCSAEMSSSEIDFMEFAPTTISLYGGVVQNVDNTTVHPIIICDYDIEGCDPPEGGWDVDEHGDEYNRLEF